MYFSFCTYTLQTNQSHTWKYKVHAIRIDVAAAGYLSCFFIHIGQHIWQQLPHLLGVIVLTCVCFFHVKIEKSVVSICNSNLEHKPTQDQAATSRVETNT